MKNDMIFLIDVDFILKGSRDVFLLANKSDFFSLQIKVTLC